MLPEVKAVVFIPLTRGKVAVIDFDDFEKVRPYKWHARKAPRNCWYADHRFGKYGYLMPMHRLILDAPPGSLVDHEDGDGLNNRRSNIRVCTKAQNGQAHRIKTPGGTSKFRGVYRYKRDSIWVAQLGTKTENFYLGRFDSEEDAARAYDAKARELFGEYAAPNFPT